MAASLDIRPLRKEDERGDFSCGQVELDRFFHHYAGQNQFKLHVAVTYVALINEMVVGFATVAVTGLTRETLPSAQLRKHLPAYPLPVLRLARLGVDLRAKGQGIGRALLRHIFGLAIAQRDSLGCIGVIVDAKPEALGFYQNLGFVTMLEVRQGHLHGDPTPMFLGINSITAAVQDG